MVVYFVLVFQIEVENLPTLPPINTTMNGTLSNMTTVSPTEAPDLFGMIVFAVLNNELILEIPEVVLDSILVEGG